MKYLLLISAFAAFATQTVYASCQDLTTSPLVIIGIEVQEIIYGPPELISAILANPKDRTQDQINLINATKENIKAFLQTVIPGLIIQNIDLKPYDGINKRNETNLHSIIYVDGFYLGFIEIDINDNLEQGYCKAIRNLIEPIDSLSGNPDDDQIVPYQRSVLFQGSKCLYSNGFNF